MTKNIIYLSGVVGLDFDGQYIREELDQKKGDITIELASPGGFVYDGIEIFNNIKNYDRGTVTIKIIGLAASMASYIALAGQKVIVESNAVYMIHNVWSIGIGDYRDFRKTADEIESLTDLLANQYTKKTGLPKDEIRRLMDDETYFYGSEIFDNGFVDGIIEEIEDINDDESKTDKITNARAKVKNTFAKMEKIEAAKSDVHKAAACIVQPQAKKIEQKPKKEELKKMTIQDLKNEHSELFAKIESDAVNTERKRIKALLAWREKHPATNSIVVDAIETGKECNEILPELLAAVNSGAAPVGDENPPAISANTEDNGVGDVEQKNEEQEKQFDELVRAELAGYNKTI